MFVIVGIGALVVWYLRKSMPESPRWLEAKGHTAEAERVLSEIEREASGGRELPPPAAVERVAPRSASLGALFSRGMLMRTLTGSVVLIALNTAVYGFIAFLPTFMVRQGINIVTSLNYTTLMSFGGPVGALLGMWLSDRAGRKPCIYVFSALAIVFGIIYPQVTDPALLMVVGFLLVTAVYVLVAIAWALYIPELFPTEIRMRGAGFCNTAGRLMTIATPQIIVPLFAVTGVAGVIGLVAGLLAVQMVMVAVFGIETKARSLEELAPSADTIGMPPAAARRPSADAVS
jgi:putative MFS transporter